MKEIKLNIDFNKLPLKPLPKELKLIVNKYIKEYTHHFEHDGWDIDYSFVMNSLCTDLLGFNPEFHLLNGLNKRLNLVIKTSASGTLVLSKATNGKIKTRQGKRVLSGRNQKAQSGKSSSEKTAKKSSKV